MNKGYLDFSFATIFAIIAGIFILGLAIYGSTRLLKTEQEVQDVKTGKEIGILLNPLEIGYETGKVTSFSIPADTRIYNNCKEEGVFGRQLIKISQKSFGKWTETDLNVSFENKYIFSKRPVEGKEFYLFSKPFEFPFKVSDLIYMTSAKDSYCFVNPPEEVRGELSSLNQKNIFLDNCSEESTIICFNEFEDCDVKINYEEGYLKKNNNVLYFKGDALMYAGVFSDAGSYECQLKRLMKRVGVLAQVYSDKANFVSRRGCNSNLNEDLLRLINFCNNFKDSSEIKLVAKISEEIQNKNKFAECKLW